MLKTKYEVPVVEVLDLIEARSLLVYFSAEAGFDDFEEGEEL